LRRADPRCVDGSLRDRFIFAVLVVIALADVVAPASAETVVRDHREQPIVRDHRDLPEVRDHRHPKLS